MAHESEERYQQRNRLPPHTRAQFLRHVVDSLRLVELGPEAFDSPGDVLDVAVLESKVDKKEAENASECDFR